MSSVLSSTQSLGNNSAICSDVSDPVQELRNIQWEALRLVKIEQNKLRDLQKLQISLITESENGGTASSNTERNFRIANLQVKIKNIQSTIALMHQEIQLLLKLDDN